MTLSDPQPRADSQAQSAQFPASWQRRAASAVESVRRAGMGNVLFIIVFLLYCLGSTVTISDSRRTMAVSLSFLEGKLGVLDDYKGVISPNDYTALLGSDGHLYTTYPIGMSLLVMPAVAVMDVYYTVIRHQDLHTILADNPLNAINEAFLATILTSITVLLFYCLIRLMVGDGTALVLSLIFALCTGAWPTASRALWQHDGAMLLLILELYVVIKARERPQLIPYAGLLAAFSFLVRPADSLTVLFLTLYIFWYHRRYFVLYMLWAIVIALPYGAWRYLYTGTPTLLPTIYVWNPYVAKANFAIGLLGILISPSRGLFVFSPILLFAIVGIVVKLSQRRWNRFDTLVSAILVAQYITVGTYVGWFGAYSFGPRLMTDVLPCLVYFMIPAVTILPRLKGATRNVYLVLFIGFTVISFAIQARGATVQSTWSWNEKLQDNNNAEEVLWSWQDPQFLH